ncbi:hypothetical protein JCM8547_007354 [Rhodosporidiobolus lusitaniae]
MPQLPPDEFLAQLAQLFANTKDKGSVFITQKRLTRDSCTSTNNVAAGTSGGGDVEMTSVEGEYPVFVRATDGKGKKDTKVKISTIIYPADYDSFTTLYHSLLRSTFSASLRPKRKKASAPTAAAKKAAKRKARSGAAATGAEAAEAAPAKEEKVGFALRLPKVVGPRRGAGVEKRRRLMRKREKLVERYKAAKSRRAGAGAAE